MIGGVTSGLFLIDYLLRPLMKMGLKFSPMTIVLMVVAVYAFLGWNIIKSAWMSETDGY